MYPAQCAGGHAFPFKKGKCEIYGAKATGSTSMRLTLVDSDQFKVLPDEAASGVVILDLSGDDMIGDAFPEPIKVRNGVCPTNASNLNGGKVMLLVR